MEQRGKMFSDLGLPLKWGALLSRIASGLVFFKPAQNMGLLLKIAIKSSRAPFIKSVLKRTRVRAQNSAKNSGPKSWPVPCPKALFWVISQKSVFGQGTNFSAHFSERTPWEEERQKWAGAEGKKKSARQVWMFWHSGSNLKVFQKSVFGPKNVYQLVYNKLEVFELINCIFNLLFSLSKYPLIV